MEVSIRTMNIKKNLCFTLVFSLASLLVMLPVTTQAKEQNTEHFSGKGSIRFYEESTTSSSTEPSTSSSVPVRDSSATQPTGSKPEGRYPSTGELVQKSLTLSGVILILLLIIVLLFRRRKEKLNKKQ